MHQVTITLTQDQAEHALLCARMALAQSELADGMFFDSRRVAAIKRRDTFATLVDVLQRQIIER